MARRPPARPEGGKRGAPARAPKARAQKERSKPRPESEWDRRAREGRERQAREREAERQRRASRPESEWDRRARAARAARAASEKKREEEARKREAAERRKARRLEKLRGPFNRAERLRQRKKEREDEERERGRLPPLPRRQRVRPKHLRDERGRFAPKDERGSTEAGWVEVWSAGWQRADGSTAKAYSSLRERPDWERYYERLSAAGGGDGNPDVESEEWKRVAREIAAEVGVHVQEVYTLGMSP